MSENRKRCQQNGLYGFVDERGEWTIEPKYDYLSEFEDGRAEARLEGGKRGYVDEAGNFTEKKTKKVTLELHQRKTDARALRLGPAERDEDGNLYLTDYHEFWFTSEYKFNIHVTDDKGNEIFEGEGVELRTNEFFSEINDIGMDIEEAYDTFHSVDTCSADEIHQHAWENAKTEFPSDVILGMLKESISEAGEEIKGELLYDPTSVSIYFEIEIDEEEGFDPKKLWLMSYDIDEPDGASVIRRAIERDESFILDTIIYDNKMYTFYDSDHVLMESKEEAIDPETLASLDGDEDEYYDEDDDW